MIGKISSLIEILWKTLHFAFFWSLHVLQIEFCRFALKSFKSNRFFESKAPTFVKIGSFVRNFIEKNFFSLHKINFFYRTLVFCVLWKESSAYDIFGFSKRCTFQVQYAIDHQSRLNGSIFMEKTPIHKFRLFLHMSTAVKFDDPVRSHVELHVKTYRL